MSALVCITKLRGSFIGIGCPPADGVDVNMYRKSPTSPPWTARDAQLQATMQVMAQGQEGFSKDPKIEDQLGELSCAYKLII